MDDLKPKFFNRDGQEEEEDVLLDRASEVDYYSLLNVSRDASADEIKKAFRQLSLAFHSDKVASRGTEEDIAHASERFQEIKRASEVLTDPRKRAIYDLYGQEGLKLLENELNNEEEGEGEESEGGETGLAHHVDTPDTFRRLYEKMMRKRQQREIRHQLNNKNKMKWSIDASQCYDSYSKNFFLPDITSVSCSQRFDTQVSESDTLQLGGDVYYQPMRQSAQVCGSYSKRVSAHTTGTVHMTTSLNALESRFVLQERLSNNSMAQLSLFWRSRGVLNGERQPKSAGGTLVVQHQLKKGVVGSIAYAILSTQDQRMTGSLSYTPSNYTHMAVTAQMADSDVALILSSDFVVTKKVSFGFDITTGLGNGVSFGLKCRTKISQNNKLGMKVDLSKLGITLAFSFHRFGQVFSLPILLTNDPDLTSFLVAFVTPCAILGLAQLAIHGPRKREKEREKVLERRRAVRDRVREGKAKAEGDLKVLARGIERCRVDEEKVSGLVIVQAKYGNLKEIDAGYSESGEGYESIVVDVTGALQHKVKQSKLQLKAGSPKSSLIGFYDPCPLEEKQLRVVYMYKNALHGVTVDDLAELSIPRKRDIFSS